MPAKSYERATRLAAHQAANRLLLLPFHGDSQLVEPFDNSLVQGFFRDSRVARHLNGHANLSAGVLLLQYPEEIRLKVARLCYRQVPHTKSDPCKPLGRSRD